MIRKTDRPYGQLYDVIRVLTLALGEITWRNLTPAFTDRQAKNNLARLAESGELIKSAPGGIGRYAVPARYIISGRTKPTAGRKATHDTN